MKMNVEELAGGIKQVELAGRLDIAGAPSIDQPF